MGMVVRTNTMSTNAYRQLGMNNTALAKSLEKLSSGYRINRAGDDSSGLAISEKMKAQIKGLEQASANSQDGISLVQTAEGALTEVHSMLNRMVELATKSANGTIQNEVDRESIQTEVDALNTEISRIAKSTNFNGINLLDGSLGTGTSGATYTSSAATGFAAGAISASVSGEKDITVAFTTVLSGSKSIAAAWSGSTLTVTLGAGASATTFTQADLDSALAAASDAPTVADGLKVTLKNDIVSNGTATGAAGALGSVKTADAKQATVTNATNSVKVTSKFAGTDSNGDTLTFAAADGTHSLGTANVAAGGNTVVYLDTNTSYTASDINSILSSSGSEMNVDFDGTKTFAAEGATSTTLGNTAYTLASGAGLASGGGITVQVGTTDDSFNKVTVAIDDLTAEGLGIDGLDVSSQSAAGKSIETIKDAINKVSTNRGNLGALQNRLEYAINNLDTTAENMDAANSRIRDTDMAKEMMNYTKMNILSQAAQAMLAQANQNPQSILQLLQ